MTATPTAPSTFSQKYGDFVRKAGSKFGFDLASLFNDEEDTEGTSAFDGFAPSFRMQTMYKGRSPSTLTYKAPKTPARIAEFSLTPEGTGATAGSVTATTPTETKEEEEPLVQEKADRLLSSFIGEGGRARAIGAMGVGRAQGYGYTNEDILAKAQAEGLKFGEQAARGLGLQTNLTSYTGLGGGTPIEGAFGMSALTAARARGLSDEAIKSLAQQQGLKFGQQAASALGVGSSQTYQAPAPAPAAPAIVSYASQTAQGQNPGAIGLAGIERAARDQNISAAEAARRAVAQGTRLGAKAQALLG